MDSCEEGMCEGIRYCVNCITSLQMVFDTESQDVVHYKQVSISDAALMTSPHYKIKFCVTFLLTLYTNGWIIILKVMYCDVRTIFRFLIMWIDFGSSLFQLFAYVYNAYIHVQPSAF